MAVRRPGAFGGPHTSVTEPGKAELGDVAVPAFADLAPEPPHPATDRARAAASMIADVALKAMCEPPRLSW